MPGIRARALTIAIVVFCGILSSHTVARAGTQPAAADWTALPQQARPNQIALECLPQGSLQDGGRYAIQAGDTFTGGVNRYGPWLLVQGDFGVQVSLEAATSDAAALSLIGTPATGSQFWQGLKRLDLGLQNGRVQVLIYTGDSPTASYAHGYDAGILPSPIMLGVRRQGGNLLFLAEGTELGRIADPGIFDSGQVYLSATVAPHNQMIIDALSVETPAGSAGSVTVMPDLQVQPQSASSLRAAAAARQFRVGAIMEPGGVGAAFNDSAQHRATLAREFNTMTIYSSFRAAHPTPASWDFCDLDAGLAYAQANQMQTFVQTLLYDAAQGPQPGSSGALPDWLVNGGLSADQVRTAVHDYITKVVGRFRGQVYAWNVENELLDDKGQARNLFLLRTLGPGYLADLFRWAHDADPSAKLYYNENTAEGLDAKSDGVYNLVKGLKDAGAPIDAVGLQMHVTIDPARKPFEEAPPPAGDVATNMQRLGALGLDVYITEMDVKVGQNATAATLDEQGQVFAAMLKTCLAAPNCRLFNTWGVSDKYSWYRRPAASCAFPGFSCGLPNEQPLLFDEHFQPKPAYNAVAALLAGG